METRKSRSSALRRATSLTIKPSATFTNATPNTSQKWEGWCSHWMSSEGTPSNKASPAMGIASATARNHGDGPTMRPSASIQP